MTNLAAPPPPEDLGVSMSKNRVTVTISAVEYAAHLAEAWQKGWEAGCNDHQYGDEDAQPWTPNPYGSACTPAK